MKRNNRKFSGLIICVSIVFLLSSCVTHIYLVRHAEKQNNPGNPPLSDYGSHRAMILRDSLLTKDIDSVFASTLLRTQQTANPLCVALHENNIIYNKDTSANFARTLKKLNGKNILVVGHSDNIPLMVNILSGRVVSIPDSIYNKMFIVTISRGLTTTIGFRETTYGPVSNPSAP